MRKLSHWLEEFDHGESVDVLRDLALSHASQGGPLGQRISKLIRAEKFREICELEFDYALLDLQGYTAEQVYHCRQAVAFFSKLEGLEIGIDKEAVAWAKFIEAEHHCSVTNEVFRAYARGFSFDSRVEGWLFTAQRKIAQVLGPVPSFHKLGYRFGKGATTLTKKRIASVREKFAAGAACSEEFLPMAQAMLGELPTLAEAWASAAMTTDEEHWFSVPVTICDGRLDFVPKSAKTYRSTVTEPPLNGLFQLAVGDYMFDRLARAGLNLRDQTRNQTLAREGSLSGKLATIDLSSASDMVSKELVYHLLPLDWAVFLARGRSGHVTYQGERLTLEKFSSMGNGFTFPLESLIFWALTCAVCDAHDDVVAVYGDDIICPSHKYGDVSRLLGLCGFTVNKQKSYHTGPFRESCGKDYYRGIDVRPYHQKNWVSGMTLFTLHNYYVRAGRPDFAQKVKAFIHEQHLIYGPDGYGDGHLLGEFVPRKKNSFWRSGWGGYLFDTFTIKGRKDVRPQLPSDFVLPAYTIYQRSSVDFVSLLPTDGSVSSTVFRARFLRRAIGSMSGSEALPDVSHADLTTSKGVSLPKDINPSYKKVSIYTF